MAVTPLIAGNLYNSVSLKPVIASLTRAGGLFRPLIGGGFYISAASGPPIPVPVNTVAPALSNTSPLVGQSVTCDTGTWTGSPSIYTYQWYRDAAPIGGATTNIYLVVSADIGAVLTCHVTAYNNGGASSPATSNATNVIPGNVPVNTVAPALDDTSPGVGDTINCSTGTWTNTPTSYTYQWFRDASSIGGATSSSYLVDAADIGAVLTCQVTAHNAGGASAPATSNATDVIPTPPGGFALLSHISAGSPDGNTFSTGNISTLGADFLVAVFTGFGGAGAGVLSDSQMNSWNLLTEINSGGSRIVIAYVASPSTSGTHHFTLTGTAYGSLCVAAFSGAAASPFDQENGATAVQPGSVTPSQNNELIIAGYSQSTNATPVSVDSGFTITDQELSAGGTRLSAALAYLIQTTASAKNPTWSGATLFPVSVIATFKAA